MSSIPVAISTPPPTMSTSTTPKPIPSSTPTGSQQSLSSSPSQHLHGLLLPQHQQQHHSHHHHHHQQTISSLLSQAAAYNTTPSMGGQSVVPTNTGLSINTMSSGPPGPSGAFSSSSSQQPKIHSPATPQSNGGGGNGGYTSSETWSSVVHSLMCHLQSSDNEQFAKRAIESLAKKLKDKPDEMDALMTAVQKKGTVPTKCITIPRTLDGRLQVAGRKGFPHVIYARLWRWPDLHKNELKHLPICAYPFDLKLDNVCVNPYHYQRVISPGFDLAGLTLSGGRSFNGQFGNGPMSPSKLDSSVGSNNGDSVSIKHEPGSSEIGKTSNGMNGNSSNSQNGSNSNFVPQLAFGNLYIQNPGQSSLSHQHHQHHHSSQSSFYPPPPGSTNQSSSVTSGGSGSFQPAQSVVAAVLPQTSNINSNASNIVLYPINQASSMDATANSSSASTQPRPPGRLTQEWQGSYPPSFSNQASNSGGPYSTNNNQNSDLWLQEEFPEIDLSTPPSDYWCTVTYFEGDLQIGDMFKVRSCYSSFIIDGFFDASREDRFCLGALTNVQRTSASEKARLHIGKGVQIENNMSSDGSVYVRALSEYSLFFESYYLDRESGREAFDAVHKIYPGSYVKVFSLKECLRCLKMATVQMQQQQKNNNANNPNQDSANGANGGPAAGLNVDDLRKLCRLRFSFVKGWGPDYMRKNILETPCWCEIQLNRPLQYLDQLINSLSRNTNLTSVFSD